MHRFYRRGRGEGKLNPTERNGIYRASCPDSMRMRGGTAGRGVAAAGRASRWAGEYGVVGLILLLFLRCASDLLAVGGGFDLAALDCTLGAGKANEQRTRRLLDVELYFIFLSFRLD